MKASTSIFAILLVAVCNFVHAQSPAKALILTPGKPIEHNIVAGQSDLFEIKCLKDQFLQIYIDQRSVDVEAILYAPSGQKTFTTDDPNTKRGPEELAFITPTAGNYRLEIRALETGRYEVNLEFQRARAPKDTDRVEASAAFSEGERSSFAGDHVAALSKYHEALRLIAGAGDRYAEGAINYGLGRTHKALGDNAKAAEYFANALVLFQTAGSWEDVFRDLSPLYFVSGGKQQALDYLAGALPLVRALKNQRLEAILLVGLSKICKDLNKSPQALEYTEQALSLFRITGKRGDEVFNLTEISDADLSLDEKNKAIEYLNQALLLSRGANDRSLEASLIAGIGYIYASIDDHESAVKYFRQALSIWQKLKDKNGEAYTLGFIGSSYFLLGDGLVARDYLERSVALVRETGDQRAEAYSISYLGAIENRLGDPLKAKDAFQKALAIFRETGEKHGEATTLSFLAEIYWTGGDTKGASENYQRSLAIFREEGYREGEALAQSNLAFIYESAGNAAKALAEHEHAIQLFHVLGNRSGEATSLYGVARVMYSRGDLDASLTNIETAINLIESIRTGIENTELRSSFLATYQQFYQFYVELLMRLDKQRPRKGFDALALRAAERGRARSLLDLLNEARADIRQGISPDLLERERGLNRQLNLKAKEKATARNAAQTDLIDKEIRSLAADYLALQAEIKLKSPRYSALIQPPLAGLTEIQKMLDADSLLLEYSLGPANSYLWVVSPNSIKSFQLPKSAEIEAKAKQLYESIKQPDRDAESRKIAGELGRIVIAPAAGELGNKRLVIVADGALNYIPFSALTDGRSSDPLVVDHEIVYLPSASTLAALRQDPTARKPFEKTLAVLADPVFDPADTRVSRASGPPASTPNPTLAKAARDAGFANTLPRLPGTRAEATTILSFVPDNEKKQAIDFEASKATVSSAELGQFRIVHFATHGLLNSVHPELSGIVLSLVDKNGKPQDGFLRLNDIYNLKLPVDLVVLSACQTALGKEIKGEGLVGLTRGFMYAGAKRVVASQWSVDDEGTSELMRLFYQGMLGEKKFGPSAALREAQIAMFRSKRFNSPYLWSAFAIQGDWK